MSTRTFTLALLLDRLAVITPPCLYLAGVSVLAWKVFPVPAWLELRHPLIAWAAVWVVAVAADCVRQARRPFTEEYVRAWLDWKNEAGGRILAGAETAPRRVTPGIRLSPFFRSLVLPGLFVAATLLAPEWRPGDGAPGGGLERQLAAVRTGLRERRDDLSPPDASRLERQLEQVRELAGRDPEAAAEALSALEKRLAAAEAMRLDRLAEALERGAGLGEEADRLAGASDAAAREALAEKADEWRESLERLVEGEGGLENMPESFRQAWAEMMEPGAGAAPGGRTAGASADGAGGDDGGGETAGRGRGESAREARALSEGSARRGRSGDERVDRMLRALEDMADRAGAGESAGAGNEGAPGAEPSAVRSGSASDVARERLGSAAEALERLRAGMTRAGAEEPGEGGVARGRGDAPLLFGGAAGDGEAEVEYTPLPPLGAAGGDTLLRRDRRRADETLPPGDFRQPWRSAVDAPDTVRAGLGAADLGPGSRRAAERYFERLGDATGRDGARE